MVENEIQHRAYHIIHTQISPLKKIKLYIGTIHSSTFRSLLHEPGDSHYIHSHTFSLTPSNTFNYG